MGPVQRIHAGEDLLRPAGVDGHLVLYHVAGPTVDVAVLKLPLARHQTHAGQQN